MLPEGIQLLLPCFPQSKRTAGPPKHSITALQPPDSPLVPIFPSIQDPGRIVPITQSSRETRDTWLYRSHSALPLVTRDWGSGPGCWWLVYVTYKSANAKLNWKWLALSSVFVSFFPSQDFDLFPPLHHAVLKSLIFYYSWFVLSFKFILFFWFKAFPLGMAA